MIHAHFASWFHHYVHGGGATEHGVHLHDLAWGPLRKVKTWSIYFVNGYKFHTKSWSEGKQTVNYGVAVKGTGNLTSSEDDFYGILNEVIQLKYPGSSNNKLVLFSCDWFDPVSNRGMKVHPLYGIVEIKHTRRYANYDPFIFAQQAIQVYYTPYPRSVREKLGWWVVIKTKPRGLVDHSHQLEVAYQDEEMRYVNEILIDDQIGTLRDYDGGFEEIDLYVDLAGATFGQELGIVDDEEDVEDEQHDDDEEDEDEEEYEDDDQDDYTDEDDENDDHNKYTDEDDDEDDDEN